MDENNKKIFDEPQEESTAGKKPRAKIVLPFKGITPISDVAEMEGGAEDKQQPKWLSKLIFFISLIFALFGIWSNSIGMLDGMRKGGIFLAFTLGLIFLTFPSKRKEKRLLWLDLTLAILGAVVGLYTTFTTMRFSSSLLVATKLDLFMGALAILLVLEATRRAVGNVLAILPLIFIAYALFGDKLPGIFSHFGVKPERLLIRMYMVDEGLYGVTTQTATSFIFLFVLFGALLSQSGVAELFNDVATKIAGWAAGGPAKVATISSGLMGMISGSAAANVATTGAFTIPLMKKTGYKSYFAGAVEAVASTGGMIMPPIMGSAAFLMAQYLGVSYNTIMKSAIIPACLYYLSCFMWVHFEAKRLGLVGIPRNEIPKMQDMQHRVFLLLPILVIIVAMVSGYTPTFSAFLGMGACILAGLIQPKERRLKLANLLKGLADGARTSLTALIACICAGIIVGVCTMTGLGAVISYNIMQLSGGSLFVALCLTAIASIILSMGLPATACYIMVAIVIAPALVKMGATQLAAHFFVFYFSCISNITPPVAIAAYTAAGLCGDKPVKVAWQAMKIAAPGFFIPFLLVYNPILLWTASMNLEMLMAVVTAAIGVVVIAIAGVGYIFGNTNIVFRIGYALGAVCLVLPGTATDLIGTAVILLFGIMDYVGSKRMNKQKQAE